MKKYINLFLSVVVAASLGSCSKENPFGGDGNEEGMGKVLKSALNVELKNEEGIPALYAPATRAAVPTADDFTVDFIQDGNETPYVSYLYSEMPEVVDLPAGAFKAVAHYGDNATAAWEAPYFKGETQFIVVADKITEVVEPITASLANVRVSIVFDSSLKAVMGSDSKVTVKVGESGSLDFTTADAERSGYFAYVENSCSLTATFSGKIEGDQVTESKVYDTVQPGSHYRITFRLHGFDDGIPGQIDGNVVVDADVEVVDLNRDIDPEDKPLVDDMRPVEGTDEPDPDQPGPVDPTPGGDEGPAVGPLAPPAGKTAIVMDEWNVVDVNKTYCAFSVASDAPGGFTDLKVVIDSPKLTEEELATIGLPKELDLVNTGDLSETLGGLGFPVNVGGQSYAEFDITSFLSMLAVFGAYDHQFIITVSDANGTVTKYLKLRFL